MLELPPCYVGAPGFSNYHKITFGFYLQDLVELSQLVTEFSLLVSVSINSAFCPTESPTKTGWMGNS